MYNNPLASVLRAKSFSSAICTQSKSCRACCNNDFPSAMRYIRLVLRCSKTVLKSFSNLLDCAWQRKTGKFRLCVATQIESLSTIYLKVCNAFRFSLIAISPFTGNQYNKDSFYYLTVEKPLDIPTMNLTRHYTKKRKNYWLNSDIVFKKRTLTQAMILKLKLKNIFR